MKPYTVAFIFARGGSKGLPRKNLLPVAGKPLVGHAIDAARAVPEVDRVIVSTDDREIADVARSFGAEIPFMRPAELAADNAPETDAWKHAVRTLQELDGGRRLDVFLCVPCTAPLRLPADLVACLRELEHPDTDLVITATEALRNPYYNMVQFDDWGYVNLVIPPERAVTRRQDVPQVYNMTTVAYAAHGEHVLRMKRLFEGRVRMVIIPRERALDIDEALDLELAEFMYRRRGEKSAAGHVAHGRIDVS
jgi:N-acylneuraminate cytidylyltransferase